MKKKTISTAVCMLLAMNLIGCSWFESHPIDYDAKEKLVIEYMNEKYDKKFNVSGNTMHPIIWAPKDAPFRMYFCTDVTIENDANEEKYVVYHDDDETHEDFWIIGDEYMMNIVEPYIRQFVEESLKEHAPCADTYFNIWGAGSSDVREQTYEFTNNFCFSPDFPVVNSYDEFLKETKNIYLYLCIYVPDSEQNIDTAVQDWQEWNEYMHSSFNEQLKLWMITVEDESFFGADDTLQDKRIDFEKTHEINLK